MVFETVYDGNKTQTTPTSHIHNKKQCRMIGVTSWLSKGASRVIPANAQEAPLNVKQFTVLLSFMKSPNPFSYKTTQANRVQLRKLVPSQLHG